MQIIFMRLRGADSLRNRYGIAWDRYGIVRLGSGEGRSACRLPRRADLEHNEAMSRYIELHPVNPQARLVDKVVAVLRDGGLIAYPTDSGYALACAPGNKEGLDRIRAIRRLDSKHNFTFVCASFAQVGPVAIVGNNAFRLIKRLTPGPWTFILKGTKDVPRMTLNPKKHTLGVRIPDHAITQALVAGFDAPILSSTFIRPGRNEPESSGWEIEDALGHLVDVVIEGPVGSTEPTTVVDLTDDAPEVMREGSGDIALL